MNKTLKWILGTLAILVLVGALFAVGFVWRSHMAGGWDEVRSFDGQWTHPMMRNDWESPMQRGGWDGPRQRGDWNYPMMASRRFSPFGGFFLFGGLVKFVLFAGLIYGAYWLGRRNARITLDPKPGASVDASAAPKTPEQDS
ncbi:MAG: hypothetical protein HY867_05270 [Chloroflexi bacterium]|nr:hypothetical protein [Chloroflexota bacterium]